MMTGMGSGAGSCGSEMRGVKQQKGNQHRPSISEDQQSDNRSPDASPPTSSAPATASASASSSSSMSVEEVRKDDRMDGSESTEKRPSSAHGNDSREDRPRKKARYDAAAGDEQHESVTHASTASSSSASAAPTHFNATHRMTSPMSSSSRLSAASTSSSTVAATVPATATATSGEGTLVSHSIQRHVHCRVTLSVHWLDRDEHSHHGCYTRYTESIVLLSAAHFLRYSISCWKC